tara:strand:+ start:7586 stop:8092 length:507 start_codon:yes stop_codon:yes gene_type:complete
MKKERLNPWEKDALNSVREANKKEQWVERHWNKNRLLKLVSYGMKIRFQKAEMLFKESLYTTDYKNISKMCEMILRGYEALTKEAVELGHLKLSPTTWVCEHNKTTYVVVKNDQEFWLAHNAYAEEPETMVIGISELFKMANDDLLETKNKIQGTLNTTARIVEYKKK